MEAARAAAISAQLASEAVAAAAEVALATMERDQKLIVGARGTRDRIKPMLLEDVDTQHQQSSPHVPSAHHEDAFEELLAEIRPTLEASASDLDVTVNAAWVKVESRVNGHRLYIAKGVRSVNRAQSTLPPESIMGSTVPARRNGRIASQVPATLWGITAAIDLMCSRSTPALWGKTR